MLVAGDLYDTAAPDRRRPAAGRPHAARAGAATASRSIAIAGNHDHAATFDAYRPLAGGRRASRWSARCARPTDGGVVEFTARSTGERATVAVLPFLSQRYAVRAAELVGADPGGEHRRLRPAGARHPRQPDRRLPRRRGEPGDGPPDRAPAGSSAAASGPRSRSSSTTCRRRSSRSTRTTSRWATCTGGRPAGAVPGALLRRPAGRRLRRAGQHARRLRGRGRPGTPAARHRHPDHGRAAAAHRARHGRGAGRRSRDDVRRRLPAGLGARAGPGRAARGGRRPCCRTRWRCASTPSSPHRSTVARPGVGTGAERSPGRAVRRVPRRAGESTTRGSSALFARLHDEVTGGEPDAPGAAARWTASRSFRERDHRRLHRRRLLRAGRAHRRRASRR